MNTVPPSHFVPTSFPLCSPFLTVGIDQLRASQCPAGWGGDMRLYPDACVMSCVLCTVRDLIKLWFVWNLICLLCCFYLFPIFLPVFLPLFGIRTFFFVLRQTRLLSAGLLETSRDTEKNWDSSSSLSDPIPLLTANEKVCFVVVLSAPSKRFPSQELEPLVEQMLMLMIFFPLSLAVLQHLVIVSVFKTTPENKLV